MASEEKDGLERESIPDPLQPSDNSEDATGRLEIEPKVVSVPSVVSKGKPKSVSVDDMPGVEHLARSGTTGSGDVAPASKENGATPLDPVAPASSDSAQEALDALYATAQTAPVSPETSPSSSQSLTDRVSGNITGNSANLGTIDQKSIDLRKEQIQRVKKREADKHRKRVTRIVRRVILVVLLILVIGTVGAFSFFRWGMNDDHADLQGTWVIEGSNNAKVKITEDEITLNKEVSYSYELDPTSKTLTFDFGQLSGSGRYRFSVDRNKLSLQDGEFETTKTLSDDIPWSLQAIWDFLVTSDVDSPELGEGSITLNRVVEE